MAHTNHNRRADRIDRAVRHAFDKRYAAQQLRLNLLKLYNTGHVSREEGV